MSTSTAALSVTGLTSSPLFAPQPTSTGRTSIDLFPTGPTGTQSAATATSSQSSGGGRGPSLYLIVFLSIFVLLLVTSISIAIRAVHFRRRYHRALARGEVPTRWADNRTTDLYPDTWWRPMVVNRFFGIDPDGDHLDAMLRGDWAPHGAGRRRKAKKDYGEVPILYEADLVSGENENSDTPSIAWSEKQPLSVAVSSATQASAFTCGANDERSNIGHELQTPNRTQLPDLNHRTNTDTNANTSASAISPGGSEIIQVRYLIRMPESEAAMQHRNEPDQFGEIISHGPLEMGVWQPILETEQMSAQGHLEKTSDIHHDEWKP